MSANNISPVVVRRRRKIVRHQREKTPEPSAKSGIRQQYSDDESSSTEQNTSSTISKQKPRSSSHRSKILSRRDKGVGTSSARSQSTPRNENNAISIDGPPIIYPPKRSLSSPRHKEESLEASASVQSHFKREGAPIRELSSPKKEVSFTGEQKELTKLEANLKRFEEERQKFELEKKKLEQEKKELDNIRFKRLAIFEKRRNEKLAEPAKQKDEHELLYRVFDVTEKKKDSSENMNETILEQNTKLNENITENSIKIDSSCVASDNILKDQILPAEKKCRSVKPLKPKAPQVPQLTQQTQKTPDTPQTQQDSQTLNEQQIQTPIQCPPESQTSQAPQTTTKPPALTDELDIKSLELFSNEALTHCDDYESSTALSSSSREGDFDDIDDDLAHVTIIEINGSIEYKEKVPIAENNVNTSTQSCLSHISSVSEKQNDLKTIEKNDISKSNKKSLTRIFLTDTMLVWKQLLADHPCEWAETKRLRNKCIADLIIMGIFCGMGGIIFRFVEGAFENFYKCGVRRVKRDFVDHLWMTSHNLREEDWKSVARAKLRKFEEELHTAHEAGMTSYSGMKSWSFINGVIYCMTIVTTIGYGHIYPTTNTGRAITMVYAIIGIPIFLILLADFGKLFTRGIKFLWAYVRRLYYTGSCRRVRKQAQVQEMIRGMEMAYEIATFRRPSMLAPNAAEGEESADIPLSTASPNLAAPPSNITPTTPLPPDLEEIDINDEFNLPISLAFTILLAYIFCGAAVYSIWEDWSFFESCYFVFISMSTIGFGDYVPKHPMYMMTSIIYLVFGLALTSMCINVVQLKLSDSFRQASAKIGATIGLSMAEEEARNSQNLTPVDNIVPVHTDSNKTQLENEQPIMNNNSAEDIPPPLLPKRAPLAVSDSPPKNDSKKDSKKETSKKKSKK